MYLQWVWGGISSFSYAPHTFICCQTFTACGGHIELMFPPHLRMRTAACAPARAFVCVHRNWTVFPIQILKISKLLNFSKFEAVTLPSPSSKVPQRMSKPMCPWVCPCTCLVCMYTLCVLYIKYMVRMFGVSLPQILELEHQTCWVLYTHIGPPNPPILAPCARAMPVHRILSLPCIADAIWLLHPHQAGPRCFNPGLSNFA